MADKDNYKELLAARLEAIHLEETKMENLPTEEDMLRWEQLASIRRAEKKRRMRTITSIAAAFVLIFAVGIAVVVGPPDAHAGGDGESVVIDQTEKKDMEIAHYDFLELLPREIQENFIIYDVEKHNFETKEIVVTKIRKSTQLDIVYTSEEYGEIEVHQVKGDKEVASAHNILSSERREVWGNKDVYITQNTGQNGKITYFFMYNNTFVSIYCSEHVESYVKKLIEEAEY